LIYLRLCFFGQELVNVKTKKLVAHFDIELKGNHKKVTERGIRAIAKKIGNRVKLYSSN
jgi:hypothetical protein